MLLQAKRAACLSRPRHQPAQARDTEAVASCQNQQFSGGNTGCPDCASKKACIRNSLQSLHPALAAEYDTARNGVGPEQVLPRSHKMAFWKDASGHT